MKISLQKITKVFFKAGKNAQEVKAVDDFDLEMPDGQLVGLLGPSGCGKSTTLNMLCGLEEPTSGKIYFADQDVTALPPELRGVGMVFQNYALYPHLSVKKNILFPLENLADIGLQLFISLMIMAVGIYLFVRFNSYSAWMNPEHPKPKKD